jgi:hypothetical protein
VEPHSFYQKQNSTSTKSDMLFNTYTTLRHTLFNQNAEWMLGTDSVRPFVYLLIIAPFYGGWGGSYGQ